MFVWCYIGRRGGEGAVGTASLLLLLRNQCLLAREILLDEGLVFGRDALCDFLPLLFCHPRRPSHVSHACHGGGGGEGRRGKLCG